ncbi:hypothetical protein ONS95_001647 [Cadophora gregata]|uniref:uncharacterized protein n=1 Tax=Cadophora gregata TaxID=51156 RepID=UPI0026DD7A31|nr:uncharacterized protein ONS95_001647 [Cadophora gregata]KAK0111275.1 hypothetical protein ONS95_001647 [Cadophora gregata]KAK0112252.1 hypothetical protein ONS96_001501 [Cadophora gregata f. sp. sojae]
MRGLKFLPLMAMLEWTVGQNDPSKPECALRCWENTRYVSRCLEDHACLCSDPNYQNSVFQCIYSQCDTAHFGSALHHAIAQCLGTNNEVFFANPPIPDRDALRRREAEYASGEKLAGSGSAVGYPTESATFPLQSANYPTDSVAGPYSPNPTSTLFPFFPLNSVTSPAITSATPTEPAYNAVRVSTTAAVPQLYTGGASPFPPTLFLPIVFTMTVIHLMV